MRVPLAPAPPSQLPPLQLAPLLEPLAPLHQPAELRPQPELLLLLPPPLPMLQPGTCAHRPRPALGGGPRAIGCCSSVKGSRRACPRKDGPGLLQLLAGGSALPCSCWGRGWCCGFWFSCCWMCCCCP